MLLISMFLDKAHRDSGRPLEKTEVPLAEVEERYHMEVRQAGEVVRTGSMATSASTYEAFVKNSDLEAESCQIVVVRTSDRHSIRPFQIMTLTN